MKKNTYETLKQQLFFYRTAVLILFIVSLAFGTYTFVCIKNGKIERNSPNIQKTTPFYNQVKKIITPLQYTGIPHINQPNTFITINLENKLWRFHNAHIFDKNGDISLIDGKYGICGDLAAYTYKKLKEIMDNNYTIEFINASESSYFPAPFGSHYLLRIIDKSQFPHVHTYILDPSFKRYARADEFDEYYFYKRFDEPPFLRNKLKDEIFKIGETTPLLIKKNFLIHLTVNSINNKFDKNNYLLALYLTRRYKVSGKYIYYIAKKNGRTVEFEDAKRSKSLMPKKQYENIKNRIKHFFNNMKFDSAGQSPFPPLPQSQKYEPISN